MLVVVALRYNVVWHIGNRVLSLYYYVKRVYGVVTCCTDNKDDCTCTSYVLFLDVKMLIVQHKTSCPLHHASRFLQGSVLRSMLSVRAFQ